ncbi:MAG: hypothetical protein C0187_00770 [Calditerrivibrio nitroreducens]|jgi:SAM-dependent methyltransferase|uniref:Methyltransferase type 11 domain-containing protein n=1 Tax=Calditerrivibrio nitroreducens TaxID=477976 RepID=A0A2J6WRB7_9BACT|nr:MAG: hypothetical protein C0187_00770 [Calditerrivibrio nitroreducens]
MVNNNFYKILSEYYDEIFPFEEDTYNFLKLFTSNSDKVLDIGSATGSYVKRFNNDGIQAYGVELSLDFNKDYSLIISDMHHLPFRPESFDFIFSIGNTLAHAKSRSDFANIIDYVMKLLKPKGKFLFQILNYDRILDNNINRLPDITNGNVTFERYYSYENPSKIEFIGVIKNGTQTFESKTTLIPITFEEVKWVAGKVKTNFVQFFGDFKGKKYFKPDSFMLIAVFNK